MMSNSRALARRTGESFKRTKELSMGTLVVGTFVTLDGVMQGPGAPEEDRDGGFELGGWLVPVFDDVLGQFMEESIGRAGAVLFGRRSYEILAGHWPNVGDDDPMAAHLNRVRKYVASRTLDEVGWSNSTLLTGEVPEAVAELKREQAGEIQVIGSSGLIQTLLAHDLVDEFRLVIAPVVLGSGKRLFGGGTVPAGLVDARTTGTGVAIHTYRRTGPPEFGTYALEQ
jgi:dihydrofolate reductase